jgi:hyperosmotically inducible periplasmic protein
MNTSRTRAAAAAVSLTLLLALAACDRVENTEMPQPPQPSVEINRQGMEGAADPKDGIGVAHNTNDAGRDSGRGWRFWRSSPGS